MSFAWPLVLPLGAVLVALALRALLRGLARRDAELHAFGDPEVLGRGSALADGRTARRRVWLQAAALGLGAVALSRPQLGERPAELADTGRDLLVLLDLSRSMTVSDVAPSRLAAAKEAVWETVSAAPGDRVGLVVFGGSAFLQLPPTSDHAAFKLFLDAASPDDLGDPATDIGTALATAGKVFEHEGDRGHRAVLLVSDGESDEVDLAAATAALRGEGIPVFTLGVGTVNGGAVPADSSEAPEKFHRDHIGRIAVSKLDEAELRAVAKLTGGVYARASRVDDRKALRLALSTVQARTLGNRQFTERADRFQWPLALAVAALLADLAIGARERRRRRHATRAPVRTRAMAAALVPLLVLLGNGCARGTLDARKGRQLYQAGDYRGAAQALDRALAADSTPDRAYHAGNAYYRLKRYEDAAVRYRYAATRRELRQQSVFNLGNALVRAAEDAPERTGELLLGAIGAYQEALRLDPADPDAKWNLEIALKRLDDDRTNGGSPGRGRNADYGRGNMNVPGYEGNPEAASGAMAGGGYGAGEGESVEQLDADQARQLLEAVQREQLASHEGRKVGAGESGGRDW
ncbi:MAG TPA: VWA domain-containing protein [Gemmatimonadales bacterium]|nr:VWA domain-containing protein [Gemmatimonadales bacterium]